MRQGRHVSPPRPRSPWAWLAYGVAGMLFVAVGFAGAAVFSLRRQIHTVDVTKALGTDRPTAAAPTSEGARTPVTVLLVGSDSREGANGFVGGTADEGRSDTTMVLHLSADRSRAMAVSIPRDSIVAMPTCTDRAGGTSPAAERQFNEAYTIGGAACVQRTVEQLTGVRIDHYVVVDFAGFKDMVDALGTVQICLPRAVNDTRHHITLPAGRSRVNGTQALAYVRERYALGDGGDLGRIGRQQAFLSSVLQEATNAGTLTDPPKLYAFLSAAARSVTMDPDLAALGTLSGLARDVQRVGLGNVRFVTVPTEPYEPDPNRLQWAPSARRLWEAIRSDVPVIFAGTPGASASSPTSSSPASSSPAPTSTPGPGASGIDPATVRVRVLNASGVPGAAGAAARTLRTGGWNVVGVGDADETLTRTRITHGTSAVAAARAAALAAWVPDAEVVEDPSAGSTLQLEIGTDAATVAAPGSAATASSSGIALDGVPARTADTDICA